jgi:hypothetical protein
MEECAEYEKRKASQQEIDSTAVCLCTIIHPYYTLTTTILLNHVRRRIRMIWDDLFFISIKSDMDGVGVTVTREILLVRRACMEEYNGEVGTWDRATGIGKGEKGWNCGPKKRMFNRILIS